MAPQSFTDSVGCTYPLQQAPLGGLGAGAARAVAAAGGLGMVAAAGMSPERLEETLEAFGDVAVGVNFLVPFLGPDLIEVAARARLVEFFWGEPNAGLVDRVHSAGALAGWQVGSEAEAVAAAQAGCDLVVAQGVEAGGHVRGSVGLLPLLARVLETVAVPVVAAGGIGTARSVAGALAAGAHAVRVGTRFVAATESGAHPRYQQALVDAELEDAVLTERFLGAWPPGSKHRVLRSALEAAEAFDGDAVGERRGASVSTPHAETTGAIEAMALYAGQSVGAVRSVQPAADIVRELMRDVS